MKLCLNPTLCHTPANHGVCRARSQCCFLTVCSYVLISTGDVDKIVFTGLLKMRQSCAGCAKTRKLQKGKEEEKRQCRVGKSKPCLQCLVCVCALKVRQSIPSLLLHRLCDCVPAVESSSSAYLTREETDTF